MQCVILAGGLATRMRPLTEKVPKAMLEAEGIPFVDYQLQWLARHGVTKVVMSIGYRGEMIREYVQDGTRWGIQIRYVDEGLDLRGTGGALRLALDQGVLDDAFLVTYGDSFLPVDFEAVWQAFVKSGQPGLMTVLRNDGQWDQSNVCFRDHQITLYDKTLKPADRPKDMNYIDYGLLAFRRQAVLDAIPSGVKVDLAGWLNRLSLEGKLAGFEVDRRFYEIGSFEGLEDFKKLILSGGLQAN